MVLHVDYIVDKQCSHLWDGVNIARLIGLLPKGFGYCKMYEIWAFLSYFYELPVIEQMATLLFHKRITSYL